MTEKQKKQIDACKDQAAKEFDHFSFTRKYIDFKDLSNTSYAYGHPKYNLPQVIDRAMQLYGEQCRKEGAEEPISVISDAIGDLDEMAPRYDKKRVEGVHEFLSDSFEKLTAQA
jgi:hypothetical protein